jgi:hypothetical protein
MDILIFLGIVTLGITIHELGHFYEMKKQGIKVESFNIGLPLFKISIFKIKYKETTFVLNLIPIAGYVKAYESEEEKIKNLPYFDFSSVMGGGIIFNIISIIIFMNLYFSLKLEFSFKVFVLLFLFSVLVFMLRRYISGIVIPILGVLFASYIVYDISTDFIKDWNIPKIEESKKIEEDKEIKDGFVYLYNIPEIEESKKIEEDKEIKDGFVYLYNIPEIEESKKIEEDKEIKDGFVGLYNLLNEKNKENEEKNPIEIFCLFSFLLVLSNTLPLSILDGGKIFNALIIERFNNNYLNNIYQSAGIIIVLFILARAFMNDIIAAFKYLFV